LVRCHLLYEIEYLCKPCGFDVPAEEMGEPFVIGPDAGRKPHGKTRTARHRMNTPAVERSACIEPHKGRIVGEVLAWVGIHPSRRRIVAEGKCHQRYDGILIGPRNCRYAWQGITSPGSCKGAWMVIYRSAMIKLDGGQDAPGATH
jgi:hypothetical protein